MRQLNETPFAFAFLAGKVNFPAHSLTLVVKGTFDLSSGAKLSASKVQLFPTGDEFYPGDDERAGSCRYESDFAYFKKRADLLLVGKCHAPGGVPAQAVKVTFRVGAKQKSLVAIGDRMWQGMLGRAVSAPEPFREMPLAYERSFGGAGFKKNPVGKGYVKVEDQEGKTVRPLPNIEDPGLPIDSPSDRPEPAGFGPLNKKWEPRQSCLGSYKGKWLKERWPWFPEDFDWAYFNAAPPDMQADGYLIGNEELYLENLHPKHAQYRSALPGLRLRCFVNKEEPGKQPQFEEVRMNLDTLWVDMEAEKVVLAWRGVCNVLSEEFEEVKQALIVSEPVETQPLSIGHYQKLLEKKRNEATEEPPVEMPVVLDEASTSSAKPELKQSNKAPEPAPSQAAAVAPDPGLEAILQSRGIDTSLFPQLTAQGVQEQARIKKELEALEAGGFEAMISKTTANLSAAFTAQGIDLNNPPPLSGEAREQLAKALKQMGIGDETSPEAAYAQGMAALRDACIELGLMPKTAAVESPAGPGQSPDEAKKQQPPPTASEKARELLAQKAPLASADLSGLDFSSIDLKGFDLSGAILAGTLFKNANLSGANLSGVSATGADFTGAKLNQAKLVEGDFTNACFDAADLTGADVTGTTFQKASFEKAFLDEVAGKGAVFTEAIMGNTSLQKAVLEAANFTQAMLHNANFTKATLKAAAFQGAQGARANFSEADLTGLRASQGSDFSDASFRQALGPGSTWKNATLQRADFSFAQMQDADFGSCNMDGASLYAADMKGARFAKASLRAAKMIEMNLFEGSLEKADLTDADLNGSNMYGVEFLGTKFAQTIIRNTNLKMTKMEQV